MLKNQEKQIEQKDIDLIKSLIKEKLSYRVIANKTGWSIATITRIKKGYYDKENIKNIEAPKDPLISENQKLRTENKELKAKNNELEKNLKYLENLINKALTPNGTYENCFTYNHLGYKFTYIQETQIVKLSHFERGHLEDIPTSEPLDYNDFCCFCDTYLFVNQSMGMYLDGETPMERIDQCEGSEEMKDYGINDLKPTYVFSKPDKAMEHIRIVKQGKYKFSYDNVNKRVHIEKFNVVEDEYEYWDYIDISYIKDNEDFIEACNRYREF